MRLKQTQKQNVSRIKKNIPDQREVLKYGNLLIEERSVPEFLDPARTFSWMEDYFEGGFPYNIDTKFRSGSYAKELKIRQEKGFSRFPHPREIMNVLYEYNENEGALIEHSSRKYDDRDALDKCGPLEGLLDNLPDLSLSIDPDLKNFATDFFRTPYGEWTNLAMERTPDRIILTEILPYYTADSVGVSERKYKGQLKTDPKQIEFRISEKVLPSETPLSLRDISEIFHERGTIGTHLTTSPDTWLEFIKLTWYLFGNTQAYVRSENLGIYLPPIGMKGFVSFGTGKYKLHLGTFPDKSGTLYNTKVGRGVRTTRTDEIYTSLLGGKKRRGEITLKQYSGNGSEIPESVILPNLNIPKQEGLEKYPLRYEKESCGWQGIKMSFKDGETFLTIEDFADLLTDRPTAEIWEKTHGRKNIFAGEWESPLQGIRGPGLFGVRERLKGYPHLADVLSVWDGLNSLCESYDVLKNKTGRLSLIPKKNNQGDEK